MVLHLHHLIKKWAGGRKKSQGDIREVPFFPVAREERRLRLKSDQWRENFSARSMACNSSRLTDFRLEKPQLFWGKVKVIF